MLMREDEDSNPMRCEAGRVYRYRPDHIRHGAVQNLDPHLGRHSSKKGAIGASRLGHRTDRLAQRAFHR